MIIADEFAVMAEYAADLLRPITEIQRHCGWLGIHFIFGTQRPAGVISAELQRNMRLRIALRVADRQDSQAVIGSDDASYFPVHRTGRAIALQPHEARPVVFQAAYTGGAWPGEAQDHREPHHPRPGWQRGPTDRDVLVDAIKSAASQEGYLRALQVLAPSLPLEVTLNAVGEMLTRSQSPAGSLRVAFGITDRPQAPHQVPAVWDLAHQGNLLIVGGPRSGRTTLLRTLAASFCTQLSAGDAYFYVVGERREVGGLGRLPQCGAVVSESEPGEISRLLGGLFSEYSRRTTAEKAVRYNTAGECGAPETVLREPKIILLIDNYDRLAGRIHAFSGEAGRQLDRLIEDGQAAGIKVAATGHSELYLRMAGLFAEKIILRCADPVEYAAIGVSPRYRHIDLPLGRGFSLPGTGLVQVATLAHPSSHASDGRVLAEIAEQATGLALVPPFRL